MAKLRIWLNLYFELMFEIGKNNWTRVSLLSESNQIYLGAEELIVIAEKIRRAISDFGIDPFFGAIDGCNVVHMISFSEAHTTVYLNISNLGGTLYFQDDSGEIVATVSVTPEVIDSLANIAFEK